MFSAKTINEILQLRVEQMTLFKYFQKGGILQ